MSRSSASSIACVAALLSGCAALHSGSPRGDADITAQIKARYTNDRTVNGSAINVATHHGVVVLSGDARDWTERTVAEQVALKVDDVRTIRNEIVIRNASASLGNPG